MKQILVLKEQIGMVHDSTDLFNKIKKIKVDHKQENLILFSLSTKHTVIDAEVVFKGGLDCCMVDPKTLFRKALQNNAAAIIVAHNHPSGDLEPSQEDRVFYDNLKNAGKILRLNCLDSIIFNEKEYFSMNRE